MATDDVMAYATAGAQDIPAEYQQVLTTLGKQGDFRSGAEGQHPSQ